MSTKHMSPPGGRRLTICAPPPAAATGMKPDLVAGDARSLRWRKDDPAVGSLRPDLILTQSFPDP